MRIFQLLSCSTNCVPAEYQRDLNFVRFVAARSEASSLRRNRVHLDRRPSVRDNDGHRGYGHHPGNMRVVGRLQ